MAGGIFMVLALVINLWLLPRGEVKKESCHSIWSSSGSVTTNTASTSNTNPVVAE